MDPEPIRNVKGTLDNFEAVLYALEDKPLLSGRPWKILAYPERVRRPIVHTVRQWIVFVPEYTEKAMFGVRVLCAATIKASETMQDRMLVEFLDGKGVFSTFDPMGDDLLHLRKIIWKRLQLGGQLDNGLASTTSPDHETKSTKNLTGGGQSRGQIGRPRNTDDDWAWEAVNAAERPQAEVYREWKERIGDRAKTLADPHGSFKKAIKVDRGSGRKKGKKGEKRE